ncbi:MAG: imelysin family protein, partial [Shimia sp.]
GGTDVEGPLREAFTRARATAEIDDPAFAGVADPIGRLRVEAIATALRDIRALVALELAPTLGVSAGFNALDGD